MTVTSINSARDHFHSSLQEIRPNAA